MVRDWSTRQSMLLSTFHFVCRCWSSHFWEILWFLIGISSRGTIMTLCIEGIWQIFEDELQIATYTAHYVMWPAKFERCVQLDMKTKGNCVSPTLGVDITSFSTLLSLSIFPYLCLSSPVHSVYFGIVAIQWRIAVKATLRGVNEILVVGWLMHQPSPAFDDVSTPVFDLALATVIPSNSLKSG